MLIDSHCHLPDDFKLIDQILENALQNDVNYVVNIGTDLEENEKVMKTSTAFENVFGVIGIYPHSHRDKPIDSLIVELEKQLQSKPARIVAIGECGIDITAWEQQRPVPDQIQLFEQQLELAKKYALPVVIHNRNGNEQVFNALKKHEGSVTGVAHCFDDDWETAKRYLDLNFFISFSGFITYNSKKHLLDVVRNVPDDKFVIETDAPYILPKGITEKPNEPKNVKMVARKIAEVKQKSYEEISDLSVKNTLRLFTTMKLNYDTEK